MKTSILMNKSMRTLAARLLPPVLSIAFVIPATTLHAQANFAGSEANIATLTNETVSQFAVDPRGNVFLCDTTNNEIDESIFDDLHFANLAYPFLYNSPDPLELGICPQAGPNSILPLAMNGDDDLFYPSGNQIFIRVRYAGGFGGPAVVAGGLVSPAGITLDSSGNVFVVDAGTGQVLRISVSGESWEVLPTFGTPVPVLTWSGIQYVAVDGQGSVYAAGGYGPSSGFVVKSHWNGASYDAPALIAGGLNDITGIAVDPAGDIFISTDDNSENPLSGETYSPAAIVDLWELPLAPSLPSGYGTPIPMGGGDFYVAQGISADAAGNVYVLWIGGPRGSFSYNVEKVDPHNLVDFGQIKTDATSQRNVTFWIAGIEQMPPTITANTPEFTAGAVSCVPDAGIPLNTDGYPVACSATVTFTPQGLGTRTGTAQLISGDTSTTIASVNLTGVGLPTYDANITIALAQSTITYPASTLLTISVFDNGAYFSPAPDGTVTLNLDGSPIVTLTLSGAGHGYAAAYYTLKGVAAGQHTLTATYSGGGYGLFPAGTSGPFSLNVLPAPVTLAVSCQNPSIVHGAAYKCEVYTQPVKAGSGTSITYQLDAYAPVSVPLSNGAATFTIPDPPVGPHTVTIAYAAQGNYAAAPTVNESFTVTAPH